jgi:TPR repeat protein
MIGLLLRRVLLALVLVGLPAAASAQRMSTGEAALREGVAAAERGDYATARRVLAPIAGHPHAAYVLGLMEMRGFGGPVDYAAAARHYSVGAAQGHPGALFSMGYLHDRGWGVLRDGKMAQDIYIASAPGELMAKNNLAYLWARQNGLLEQALCLSAETLAAQPDNMVFLDTYGFILLRMNQPKRAEAYFRKALSRAPDHPTVHEHIGDVLAMTGRADEARDWYQRAGEKALDSRQAARLAAKRGGAPAMHDLDQHPAFPLRGEGFARECGVPAV